MKKIVFIAILFILTAFTFDNLIFAQQTMPERDDVVRITSNLVRLDTVVTDKNGSPVTDLTAADFEIYQDGKPQKVTSVSYVNTEIPDERTAKTAETKKSDKNAPVPPPVRLKTGNVGRILTFIVDDGNCTASQIGMIAAREALEKFVKEQMQPNDVVAIYQTRNGSSLLQRYTSDKTQLLRTTRKVRWYPAIGACGNRSGDVFEAARADYTVKVPRSQQNPSAQGQRAFESDADIKRREAGEDFGRDNQVVGTVGVLQYVVRGLEKIGGRKTVFLMSDGIPLRTRDGSSLRAQDALRDLTDSANRAAVVFHTIDVRGLLNPTAIQAGDEVLPETPNVAKPTGTDKIAADRTAEVRNTQDGMFFLADETGGRFYHDSNFLDVPIRRALNLEKGYYLLTYQPDDETFKGKKFHKIEIKLKRPEFNARSRSGFFGVTDENIQPKKRTGDSELYEALVAPLPNAGLDLQLSAFFGNTPTEGNFVRSLVHVNGADITFVDEPNGNKKMVFDVIAVTMNEKNQVVDEFNRTHTIHAGVESLALIKQNGLIYTVDVPVKKAGSYTFRVAMRDDSAKQLGAASQIIEVPDLKKGKLFLSGLTASSVDANGKFISPSAVRAENAFAPTASTSVPAIRKFRAGDVLAYAYTIYNAQSDKTTNQPKLMIQTLMYRDGQLISPGQPQPAQLEAQSDATHINDFGYLRLNPGIQIGDYALQVVVKDILANQTSSQWIDFEIVN